MLRVGCGKDVGARVVDDVSELLKGFLCEGLGCDADVDVADLELDCRHFFGGGLRSCLEEGESGSRRDESRKV